MAVQDPWAEFRNPVPANSSREFSRTPAPASPNRAPVEQSGESREVSSRRAQRSRSSSTGGSVNLSEGSRRHSRGPSAEQHSFPVASPWTLTDWFLLATLIATPLAMGGREPIGHLVLSGMATFAAAWWLIGQLVQPERGWKWTWTEPLAAAALLLVGFQLVALPVDSLLQLSPHHQKLLPLWFPGGDNWNPLGRWTTITFSPHETRIGMTALCGYVLFFLTLLQRLETRQDVERWLRILAGVTLAFAVFGLVQYFTSNGKFFWIYEHPLSTTADGVKGSFTNRNHFANFVALGIGPLVAWLVTSLREPQSGLKSTFLGCGLLVLLAAALLSMSRGGAMAAGVGLITVLFALNRAGELSAKLLLTVVLTVGLVGAGIAAFGMKELDGRLSELVSFDASKLDEHHGRRTIWATLLKVIADFPVWGTGVGSHRDVHAAYLDEVSDGHEYTHAENGYLNVTVETGFVGGGLLAIAMLCSLRWCFSGLGNAGGSEQPGLLMAPCLAGLLTSFAHACGDFAWYAPGCTVAVLLLAACACRAAQLNRNPEGGSAFEIPLPRFACVALLMVVTAIGGWCGQTLWPVVQARPHWQRYQLLQKSKIEAESPEALLREILSALIPAAKADPDDSHIQLALALHAAQLFELAQAQSDNPMTLQQLNEAARTSQFASLAELREWFERATGPHQRYLEVTQRATRRALRQSPLMGMGYLTLKDVGFLAGLTDAQENLLLHQAQTARPHDARILFVLGQHALLAGDAAGALVFWKDVFHRDVVGQVKILALLTPNVSAEFILQQFEPTEADLPRVIAAFESAGRNDALPQLWKAQTELTLTAARKTPGAPGTEKFLAAAAAFQELKQPEQARDCLREACEHNPGAYDAHLRLGWQAMALKDFHEAVEQFQWCAQQRPDDPGVQSALDQAARERLQQTRQPNGSTARF